MADNESAVTSIQGNVVQDKQSTTMTKLRKAMAMAGGRPKEPAAAPKPQSEFTEKPLFWVCTCPESSQNCKRHTIWKKLSSGEERYAEWLSSKHMAEIKEADYFPIYMLLKLKYSEARATLRDMFYDCQAPAKWVVNPVEPLQLFCDSALIPWKKPGPNLLESEADYKKRVINHFTIVTEVLLQHYFHLFNKNPTCYTKLLRLVTDIYIDLLKLNNLSYKDYLYYFRVDWITYYLQKNPDYSRMVTAPKEFIPDESIQEFSTTVLAHVKKPARKKVSAEEAPVPPPAKPPIPTTSSASAPPPVNLGSEEPSTSQAAPNGSTAKKKQRDKQPDKPVDIAKELEKKLKLQEKEKQLQGFVDIWKDSYMHKWYIDPVADGLDICDCTKDNCAGCFDLCVKCNTRKCNGLCRHLNTFHLGDLVAQQTPQHYLWRQQYRDELEQRTAEMRRQREQAGRHSRAGPSGRSSGSGGKRRKT